MEKVKICVAGLGGIAQVMHLPVLSKMDGVEIAGVCDVDKSKSKSIAERYNVKAYYTDFGKMLDEVQSDCVIIAVPTSSHKELAIKAMEKGLNVLVEKPLARNYSEANEIVEAARMNKKKLMVGMNNRFRPDFMMQESFISAGEIGEIFYVKAGYLRKRSTIESWVLKPDESGGGVFMDLGIILLDLSLWIMKFPKIKSVTAVHYFHSFKSVEDSSFVLLRFANNSTVTLETSWSRKSVV